MECYLLFSDNKQSIQSITLDKWTIYCVYTPNLQDWVTKLKSKPSKFFIQNIHDITGYANNNLYKSLFNDLPLPWIQFIFQNELQILRISQDLELISISDPILPKVTDVFKIFKLLKPRRIKVMLIGQDPYPQAGVADGIAFSTSTNSIPASLKNIFSELKDYEGVTTVEDKNPDLTRWVTRGCLLINSAWTVSENKVGSHTNLWKGFVENLIRYILEVNSQQKIPIAFFGAEAKTKFHSVAKSYSNAIVLSTTHPSPQSADKGFFNSQIFTKINEHLTEPIDWS